MDLIYKILEPIIPTFQQFAVALLSDIVIFMVVMAIIYTIGQMLELTTSDRIKNSIALFTIIGLNYFQNYKNELSYAIFNIVIHSSIDVLLYVLIGFRLFDRVDDFLDKHFGKDRGRKKK